MGSYMWTFSCVDNGGKRQVFTIRASSKDEAIRKGFEKARKHARGDIYPGSWHCALQL